jgi:prepilin-type N-terminal cleavage/methylation domain-containing protein
MKNGFTLIELLAVIVILALIALIEVPIVLNIINDSKESSLLRSAEFYLDAVEYTIADAFLNHGGLEDGEYPITEEGNICKTVLPCTEENTLKVEVNGEHPKEGTIKITNGKISDVSIKLDSKTIVKNSEGKLVYQERSAIEKGKFSSVCKPVDGTEYNLAAGSKYTCEVKDGTSYTFYVLNVEAEDNKDTYASSFEYLSALPSGYPYLLVITSENGIYEIAEDGIITTRQEINNKLTDIIG